MKALRVKLIHPWSEAAKPVAPQPQRYRWGMPGGRTWRVHKRIYRREWAKRKYWTNHDATLAYQREWRRQNVEVSRARSRRYRYRHLSERRLYAIIHYQDRRVEILAAKHDAYAANPAAYRAKRAAYRASKPGYKTREQVSEAARSFEAAVVELRAKGMTWADVASVTGHHPRSCRKAYHRIMPHKKQSEVMAKRRTLEETVVALRERGFTFDEIALKVGAPTRTCANAWVRAMRRRQEVAA